MAAELEIVPYQPEYREYFEALNLEWLEAQFRVEPIDRELLGDPERTILARGGHIYFARLGDEVVGTFALYRLDDARYELAKMAVTPRVQGRGIGQRLVRFAIERARELGASKLVLETNSGLAPALHVYSELGFVAVPEGPGGTYERADVAREIELR